MSNDLPLPSEAVEAAALELAPHPWSMYTDAAKDHFRGKATAVLRAGINAWPGIQTGSDDGGMTLSGIYLPITENSNDKA